MTIELVIVLSVAIYGGVELVKHLAPSYYHRTTERLYSEAHERIDVLEQKIAEIVGEAK